MQEESRFSMDVIDSAGSLQNSKCDPHSMIADIQPYQPKLSNVCSIQSTNTQTGLTQVFGTTESAEDTSEHIKCSSSEDTISNFKYEEATLPCELQTDNGATKLFQRKIYN